MSRAREKNFKNENRKNLELELIELLIRQRGPRYPEFIVHVGIKKQLFGKDYEDFWYSLQNKLPIREMFLQIIV